MTQTFTRTMLALAMLAALGSAAAAEELWFSDEEQLPSLQQPSAIDGQVKPAFEPPLDASQMELPESENEPAPIAFDDDSAGMAPCDCGQTSCCSPCDKQQGRRRITADIELMALRAHFGEEAVGKLAEKYELSERFVIAGENANGIGARFRYWTYDRRTPSLQDNGQDIRFDFDVIDFEGTTRFATERMDVVLAGGVRWADVKIDIDDGRSRNDMPGATFAVDARGLICRDCQHGWEWHSISGARWSIFGGDWEGSDDGLIEPTRDDNITVMEIYGGIEWSRRRCGRETYIRLVCEAQNWRSDALGENTDVDSLSFIGPGLNMGTTF